MMEDGSMEIQLLITGPANEANLYEVLGGASDHNTHQMGYELDALNGDGAKSVQNIRTDHEMEDYLEPSMLAPWRCGPRATRMRSRSQWRAEVRNLYGSQCPRTTCGNCTSRKNNEHWTENEMIALVNAVSKEGVGKWSKVKGDYFSASIRTTIHLMDKWRNLVRACKAKKSSKKKVNVQNSTKLIVKRFRHRILSIEDKHLAKKKK